MNDEEFIARFEDCTLPLDGFHHREHVKLAWLYLRRYPALEALGRFSDGLRRFAATHGKHGLYHETITWGFILLIHERMARSDMKLDWDEFARANADLLDWRNNILKTYYREKTLASDLAKNVFVLPDRLAGGLRENSRNTL